MSFVTAEAFANQLNRLADAAAVSNPLINPPLIGGTAWAATTAYVTGNIVGNGAYSYICKTSGTSAGSGGPTGTGVSITDGSVVWDFYADWYMHDTVHPNAAGYEYYGRRLANQIKTLVLPNMYSVV